MTNKVKVKASTPSHRYRRRWGARRPAEERMQWMLSDRRRPDRVLRIFTCAPCVNEVRFARVDGRTVNARNRIDMNGTLNTKHVNGRDVNVNWKLDMFVEIICDLTCKLIWTWGYNKDKRLFNERIVICILFYSSGQNKRLFGLINLFFL